MGDILHAIDFDQLQIENKQYLAKIEERNAELIKLKVTAGNTIQNLNHHRVCLFLLLAYVLGASLNPLSLLMYIEKTPNSNERLGAPQSRHYTSSRPPYQIRDRVCNRLR
jgi:hypothetical protein